MGSKKIIIYIFTFFIAVTVFGLKVKKQKAGKYKTYEKYHFKIRQRKTVKYSLNKTNNRRIMAHKWKIENQQSFLEIRCARDFVHLGWHALINVYKENVTDIFKSVNFGKGKKVNVLDRWIWKVSGTGELKKNRSAKIILFIARHRNFIYFISVIHSNGNKIPASLKNIVNSLEFL